MGFINSTYLAWQHYRKKPLVCPMNHDCGVVTESKWSSILFVRNEILGLLFFIFLLAGGFIFIFSTAILENLFFYLVLFSGLGVIFSIFLVFIQAHIIKDYCFYCLISAFLTLLIFLNSIIIFVN